MVICQFRARSLGGVVTIKLSTDSRIVILFLTLQIPTGWVRVRLSIITCAKSLAPIAPVDKLQRQPADGSYGYGDATAGIPAQRARYNHE